MEFLVLSKRFRKSLIVVLFHHRPSKYANQKVNRLEKWRKKRKTHTHTHPKVRKQTIFMGFRGKKPLDVWLNGMTLCTSVLLETMYHSYDDNVHIKHTTKLCVGSAQFPLFIIIIHIISSALTDSHAYRTQENMLTHQIQETKAHE